MISVKTSSNKMMVRVKKVSLKTTRSSRNRLVSSIIPTEVETPIISAVSSRKVVRITTNIELLVLQMIFSLNLRVAKVMMMMILRIKTWNYSKPLLVDVR